jgi:hypothetical protein
VGVKINACSEYYEGDQIREDGWAGHVACVGVKSNACSVLVGKHAGKSQLGNHRCRWEDNMKGG